MAKVMSFMIGDSIIQNIGPSGAIQQLSGPTTVLRPQVIPSNYSFALAIGIRDLDITVENSLRLLIKDTNNDVAFDSGENTLPAGPLDKLPKEYSGFLITTDIRNLLIQHEGLYSLEIVVNGEKIATEEIPVFLRGDSK